jgi:hypothetical protein
VIKNGKQPTDLRGEYLAFISGRQLWGMWRGEGLQPMPFELACNGQAAVEPAPFLRHPI